jgi:outer membrane protein
MRSRLLIATLLFAAAQASAQAAPAAPPVPAAAPAPAGPSWAPAIPGVCLVGREQVVEKSAAGADAMKRLQQFQAESRAGLSREEAAIGAEQRALQAQAKTLPPATLDKRAAALKHRMEGFQPKVQAKNAQLAQARDVILSRIDGALSAAIPELIATHHCAVIFDKGGSLGVNPAMDITDDAIAAVNKSLPKVDLPGM